jgi:poly-gamma-glutamate synthesis protein (capsule biosynthesis protein)
LPDGALFGFNAARAGVRSRSHALPGTSIDGWASGDVVTRSVTLAFLGDLMLGRGVSRKLRHKTAEWFWGDTLPVLRATAGVFANLESPLTATRTRWTRSWKYFHFRGDPEAVDILRCANVRFVCLANNHILDFETAGLFDTRRILDEAGIRHAGAGRDMAEAAAPVQVDLAGLRVGVIAATDNMRAFRASAEGPGTHLIDIGGAAASLGPIRDAAAALRRDGAGLIVLSIHWGPNMRRRPSDEFRVFARAAIDNGIDVLHGHSAHVFQGIERHGRGLILYDTGNFLDDYWKFPFRHDDWSFVFLLDLEDGRMKRLRLIPVLLHPWPVSRTKGETFRHINARMTELCAAYDTPVVGTAEGLEIPLVV